MAASSEASLDLESLHRLKSTEPPLWLAPNAELSETARSASQKLFSFLKTYCPKSPFDQLLVNGFDAEQIWHQIDLQSQPLLLSLKREVKKFVKNPGEIGKIKKVLEGEEKGSGGEKKGLEEASDGFDEELDEGFDDDMDEEEEEEEEKELKGEEEEEDEDEGSESEKEEMEVEEKGKGGIEDDFLKINELQEYLEEDEAREYGLKKDSDNKKKKGRKVLDEDEDEEDDDEDEEDEEEVRLLLFYSVFVNIEKFWWV